MPWLTPNALPENQYVCRVIRIPNDLLLVGAVSGALLELTKPWNWEPFGELSPDEMARLSLVMVDDFIESNACMIGAIFPYASEQPPPHALPCDGGTYNRLDYPKLYDALDSLYILDADTFTVPSLNDRFILGAGGDYSTGGIGGAARVTLTVDEMPSHAHTDSGHQHTTHTHLTGLAVAPGEVPFNIPGFGAELSGSGSANIQASGGGASHENMPPFLALPYCIVAR